VRSAEKEIERGTKVSVAFEQEGRPAELVRLFVDLVLNQHIADEIGRLFSRSYWDHDPFVIPGFGETGSRRAGVPFLHALVAFLTSPSTDFHFTLEDLVAGDDRAAYRLYGQGMVRVQTDDAGSTVPVVNSTRGTQDTAGRTPYALVNGQLYLEYTCVGIFKVGHGQLLERWGPLQVK